MAGIPKAWLTARRTGSRLEGGGVQIEVTRILACMGIEEDRGEEHLLKQVCIKDLSISCPGHNV